jgi:hypothetical protein
MIIFCTFEERNLIRLGVTIVALDGKLWFRSELD